MIDTPIRLSAVTVRSIERARISWAKVGRLAGINAARLRNGARLTKAEFEQVGGVLRELGVESAA
jgi:hypothetical protein